MLYHYILRDAKKNGEGDLVIAGLSLMDSTKHVNSMPMPGATKHGATMPSETDEDMPSDHSNKRRERHSRKGIMTRLSKTLDNVIRQYNPRSRKRKTDVMDIIERKIRVKAMRLKLKQLNDNDPDSDYERDDNLLHMELSTVNEQLQSLRDITEKTVSSATMVEVDSDSTADTGSSAAVSTVSQIDTGSSSAKPRLTKFIWVTMVSPSTRKTLLMLDTIPKTKFKESRGGDEGFEGEMSFDLSKKQKKVIKKISFMSKKIS